MLIDYVKNILKIDLIKKVDASDVLLYCHDNDRGVTVFGKRYSQLIDTVGDIYASLGYSSLTIAAAYSNLIGDKAYGNVISMNGAISRAKVLDRFFSKKNNFQINFWESLLGMVSPKIIIGIQPPKELCAAARKKKVLIVDLQHGVISSEGYYGLSYRKNMNQYGWPNIILCWNDTSADYLIERVECFTSVKVLGNPWHLKLSEDQNLKNPLLTESSQIHLNNQIIILISMQWGDESLNENFIHPALIEYIKTKGRKYEWRIRIHPSRQNDKHIRNRLDNEFKGMFNVDWLRSSTIPIPILLKEISHHITRSSATTIEASLFGIKTAILDPRVDLMKEWFFGQLNDGSAEIIKPTVDEISNWIEKPVNEIKNIRISPEIKFGDFKNYLGELICNDISP